MTTFATSLSTRITDHKLFWEDYLKLRVASATHGIELARLSNDQVNNLPLDRLIYSASVLCQSDVERHMNIAQAIALSVLIIFPASAIRRSVTAILATLGNFPGIDFIERQWEEAPASFFESLRTSLLASINTVDVGGSPRALTNFQLRVWNSFVHESVLSISAPTSAGKSFVVLEHLCRLVSTREKVTGVYVAPTRALIAEVQRRLEARLSSDINIRITSVPAPDSLDRPKQVYVLTQERLSALLSVMELRVDIVVVDEGQSLADGTRGMVLQDALERLRVINQCAELIFLSPSVSGFPQALKEMGIGNVAVQETTLSPVLQNRILVRALAGHHGVIELELLEQSDRKFMARLKTLRGMENSETRLAAVALELGGAGGSLVYATGPAEAERICLQLVLGLSIVDNENLRDLSSFIKEHIHDEYGLAAAVLHGVAFHYGKMPTLLREAIEKAFQVGALKYMVCTTTLFQGVNLPARNVFIKSPTRGKQVLLDPAHLWNFAGRAGRLGRDVAGDVFLVDYDDWGTAPFDNPAQLRVSLALSNTIENNTDEIIAALAGKAQTKRDGEVGRAVQGAAGYLVARTAIGDVDALLDRIVSLSSPKRQAVLEAAIAAEKGLGLSAALLRENWTVNPHGLARLKSRLQQEIGWGSIAECIPCSPSSRVAFATYARMFNMVATEVLGHKVSKYGAFVASYALPWMRGSPYPVLVAKWVANERKTKKKSSVDALIRGAFDFIEDTLRFQWVQLGKAYAHVLSDVLAETGHQERRAEMFDFSTALELGVSSETGRSLMELGLSRITAAEIGNLIPDSALSVEVVRDTLRDNSSEFRRLSNVIVSELFALGLIIEEEGEEWPQKNL